MWQPNRAQWRVIWIVAALLVLGWPAEGDRSLAVKSVNWLADPAGRLPHLPGPLPMGLGDDGDAVAAHDMEMQEYDRLYASSWWMRTRLQLRDLQDPIAPATERQILIAIAALGGLLVWRLSRR